MIPVSFLPLALVVLVAVPPLLARYSSRANRVITRIAMLAFGEYVGGSGPSSRRRRGRLQAAHVPTTYRLYAAKTVLYAALSAIGGSVVGIYLIGGLLTVLQVSPARVRAELPQQLWFVEGFFGLPELSLGQIALLFVVSGVTIGAAVGAGAFWIRWWLPKYTGTNRTRRIDANLPRTVAFIYALSRSGMAFPKVLAVLGRHEGVYGEAAREVRVAVRDMELFNRDMITAIQRMGRQSPSDQFQEFTENLASVLQSGRSLSEFLHGQYEAFQEEAEAQQEQLLNLLATLAEVYVTVLVAGPLFLITILVIMGIASRNTLTPLRVFVYGFLPLANVGFILYLGTVTESLSQVELPDRGHEQAVSLSDIPRARTDGTRADGGHAGRDPAVVLANRERLAIYRRFRRLRGRLRRPLGTVIERPSTLLYLTVPIAIAATLVRLPTVGPTELGRASTLGIQAVLFVVGTFAIVYEIHRRRVAAIEEAVPDFLDRLASVNEAGMTIVESIDRIRGSDLQALDAEIDRVWADIQLGADVETALRRFERRVRSKTISRIVTLITKSMNASGDLATVLRIAADQAKADRRLKRQREREMVTYLLVVYISFLVFLFIIGVLDAVLIESLPSVGTAGPGDAGGVGGLPVDSFQNLQQFDADAYRLLFYHSTVVQGLFSGLIAGQLAAGDIRNGAKHAAILLAIAYWTFAFVL